MQDLEKAAAEVGGLRLPPGLEPLEVIGRGRRAIVFRASYRGEIVAMKAYRPEFVEKFKNKYDKNIAVLEMSRNRKFRKIPELLPYTAKPLTVLGHDGRYSLLFLQEFINGIPLTELAEQKKGLPESVIEAGEKIVRISEINEIKDLNLDYHDVMVREVSGVWQPVLYDFNEEPRAEEKPKSRFSALFGGKQDRKAKKDYKQLHGWREFSEKCAKS